MAGVNPPWRLDPLQMPVNINWSGGPGGNYVLIQFGVRHVPGDYHASSPTGSIMSYGSDPINGTECPLTVAIDNLFPGAKLVYQNTNLVITPTINYFVYLVLGATFNVTDTPTGPCSGSVYNRDEALVVITPSLPSVVSRSIGYHNAVSHYNGDGGDLFTTAADAAAREASLNGGGPGSIGGASGYSEPDNVYNFPSGPWTCFDISGFYAPYVTTTGTFYSADFKATFVIQLPFGNESPPPSPEIPAFSVRTTGYPWSAEILVFPHEGISVDPSNPSFPLKWTDGSPPHGADGGPWSPFGTPSTNIKQAYLFDIFYEDSVGTGTTTDYPFAIVVADHLTSDPPPSPVNPNVRNSILQIYPTFVSTITSFGEGSDWYVDGYADVPYGTSFKPPDAWGYSTSLTVPGPLPLIDVDTPY
jgi:hypothetical protein